MDYQVGQGVKFERKPGYTGYGVICGGNDNWLGVFYYEWSAEINKWTSVCKYW